MSVVDKVKLREPVGEAGALRGASGFTTAVFESSKVPEGTKLYAFPQPAEQQSCPVCKGSGLNPLVDVPVTCANCHGVQPSGQQSAPSSQNVVLLHKSYGGESIYEATRDFAEAFDENFNDQLKAIPEYEHGIFRGKFTVHVTWSPE